MARLATRHITLLTLLLSSPVRGAEAQSADPLQHVSAGRIVAISDGDFTSATYTTGQLAPVAAGHRDQLTVLTRQNGRFVAGRLPVSNSVTAAPEVLTLTPDGRTAFVVERLGQRPQGGTTARDLPPGRHLFAIDLSDAAAPRLADTADVAAFPEALAVSPDGRRVAVVSNTEAGSFVQLATFADGRFGPVQRFDLAQLGVTGAAPGPRGGVTATNVHWHPSGRAMAVNINTQDRIVFLAVADGAEGVTLRPWGAPVPVGKDPFVGRFTPDGRYYLTSNWGRNLTADTLEGRIPEGNSTISVIRLAAWSDDAASHAVVATAESGPAAEGLAVSPDSRLVATVNMGGSVFLPGSPRFRQDASVVLLALDPATGRITRMAEHALAGSLPEGGVFDRTGEHFLATVFQGHDGAAPAQGPGLEVFRIEPGSAPALRSLGRVPLAHGAHHVDVGG
jgi:DNA-binding beta-propeller fold protein YncE